MDGIREFMNIYLRCWEKQLYDELSREFIDGQKNFQNLPQSKKALALTLVFNDSKGIINFITIEADKPVIPKDVNNALNTAFHFIQFIINEFQDVCEPYVIRIKNCCVFVSTLKTAAYLHKVSCMTLIKLMENFGHIEMQLDDVIQGWMQKVRFFTDKELNPILRVISMVARHHPESAAVAGNASVIEACTIKLFERLFQNIERNKPHVLQMTIESLVDLLHNFPLKETDPELLKFYSKIKDTILVAEKGPKHDVIKAILKFITQQMPELKGLILKDNEFWLRFIQRCQKVEEYKDIPANALKVYYEVIGIALNGAVHENKSLLQTLRGTFLRNLANEHLNKIDLKLTVHGYTNIVEPIKKVYKDAAVEEMFSIISSRILPLYFSENEATDYFEDINDYQESLSRILLHMSNVSNDQIKTLVKLSILVIKRYPELPVMQQNATITSLKKTISNVEQLKALYFQDFIKSIIYEGIIWSCSHSLYIDAELQKDLEKLEKRPICYKNYIPLWRGLLNPAGYDKISTPQHIVNELIETCIKLINTLNLTVKTREDNVFSDLTLAKVAENESDFRIFLNLVDLYDEIFSDIIPTYLKDKFPKYLYEIIKASYKYPLLSGFYRLVDRALNVDEYFDTKEKIDNELFKMILQYLQNTLHSVCQFPYELQVSCTQLILRTPIIFVPFLIDHLVPIFKIALNIGLNDYDVANSVLSALENYSSLIEHEKMNEFIKELMPSLEMYLRSKESLQIYDDSFNPKRVTIKNNEEGLENLQKRILLLFGKFQLSVVMEFIHNQSLNTGATWDKKDLLKYSLNFPDVVVEVQLDTMLPRIIELASNCSDRRTRVAASEVLHSIIAILLGKTANSLLHDPDRFSTLYKALCPVLLKLGSDSDEVIRQLYNPLTLQITHWLSSKFMLHSPAVSFLIDSLFDGLSDESNSSLRDFSGICLAEFTKWTIKQSTHEELSKYPVNINSIVENITNFALHPSKSKRIAAAIAFNYLYKILSKTDEVVNIFWFELLYAFVKSMHGCDDSNIDMAINNIEKTLIKKSIMFNENYSRRKIPSEFNGRILEDAVIWLLTQCGSLDNNVRKKSMDLFESLSLLVDNKNSATSVLNNFIASNGIQGLNKIVLKDTDDTVHRIILNSDKSVKFLKNLLRTFDCYNWLLTKKLVDPKLLFSDTNLSREIIFTCIKNFSLAALNLEQDSSGDAKNIALVCNLLCEIILSLYEFILTILNTEIPDKYWIHDQLFTENLFALISRCITNPQSAGFDVKNLLITESLPLYLERMFKAFVDKLSLTKIHVLEGNLNTDIESSAVKIFEFEENFSDNYMINLNIVKGLILLHKCGIFEKLHIGQEIISNPSEKILLIFNSLKVAGSDDIFELSSEKKLYFEYLLQLLLIFDTNGVKTIIDRLLTDVTATGFRENTKMSHGEYFFNTFKDVIISRLLRDADRTVKELLILLDHFPDVALYLSQEIVIWVLNRKTENSEMAEKLANEFITEFVKFKRSINNLESRNKLFTNIYRTVVRLKENPLDILHERGPLYAWILYEFQMTNDLAKKTRILNDFLICLTNEDTNVPEIRVILESLKKFRKSEDCEVLQGDTLMISKITECFQTLLTLLPITKSTDVFYATINFAMGIGKSIFNDATHGLLIQYINSLSEEKAFESLEITYKLFMDTSIVNERLDIIRHFMLPIIGKCSSSVIEKFFEKNIKEIFKIITLELPKILSDCKRLIVSKIGCYNLIEFMFNRLGINKIDDKNGFIVKNVLELNPKISVTKNFFKCTIDVRPLTTEVFEHEEILRLLHCAAYNCGISIASTTREKEYYLMLFAENSKTGKLIWERIVDCKKVYELSQTFKEYPKQRRKLVNIKNVLNERRNDNSNLYSYVKSYNLATSTLNDNIRAYDFSEVILLSGPAAESLAITLEADDLNNHECMYSICGILKLMVENEISIGSDPKNPPQGIKSFSAAMRCSSYNSKLFMLKIVLNNQAVFKRYAEMFLLPTLSVISEMLAVGKLNYVITDALMMLVDWAEVAIPDDKTSGKANEVFAFLAKKIDEDTPTEYVVRYNFRILELLVQVWHHCLEIAPGLDERIQNTKQQQARALRFILIYLANNMAQKIVNDPNILEFLIFFLRENWVEKEEYALHSCEAIALFLKFSDVSAGDAMHDECSENVRNILRQLQLKNPDRLVKCIHVMCTANSSLADCFFEFIMGNFAKVGPPNLARCIEVLIIRLPRMTVHEIDREIRYLKILDCLNNKVISCEKACLELIHKLVDIFDATQIFSLATLASSYSRHDSPDYRKLTYDIFMEIFVKFSRDISDSSQSQMLVDMSKRVLLSGLLDPVEELQNKLTTFWTEKIGLKETCTGRIIDILDIYTPDAESDFLPIFTIIFLHLTKKSPNYQQKLFESLNASSNYKNYKIAISWRMKNLSYRIPMFTNSYASQYTQRFSLSSFAGDEMISTYDNLMTQTANTADLDKSITASDILGTSSTLKETDVFIAPEAPSRNILSKRFLRSTTTLSTFQDKKLENYQNKENAFRQELNRQRNSVKLQRMYRIGDFPDIEITNESVISPLLELVKRDQLICKDLVVSLIDSLINQTQKRLKNGKTDKASDSFQDILEKKLNYILENRRENGLIISAALEIMFRTEDIKFDPAIVTHVSQAAGFNYVGALLLERTLFSEIANQPPKKRSRVQDISHVSSETNQWIQLAELYESINEVDIVLSIFKNHTQIDDLRAASSARADGLWHQAYKHYGRICNSEIETIQRHSRQGVLECLARLCDWSKIIENINHEVDDDRKRLDYILEKSSSPKDGYMAYWYFQALIYRLLNQINSDAEGADKTQERQLEEKLLQEFMNDLIVFFKIPSKAQVLKDFYAEEIAGICTFDLQAESKDFINSALDKVKNQWNQLNPLSTALRAREVIKLRGISNVDIYRKILDDPSKTQSTLVQYWLTSVPHPKDDLLPWDKHIAFRTSFSDDFSTFLEMKGSQYNDENFDLTTPIVKLKLQMIEAAFQQENKSLMKNYLESVFHHIVEDDNELHNQFKLNKVRFRLLRAKVGDNTIKQNQYPSTWKDADDILHSSHIDIRTRISTRHVICDLATTIIELHDKEPDLYEEIKESIAQYIYPFMENPGEEIEALNACCFQNLKACCFDASKSSLDVKIITDCYEKLLKYCHEKILQNEIKINIMKEFVKSVLRAISFNSRVAANYFPCLLNNDYLQNEEIRKIFMDECKKIPVWKFLKWQAQLLHHLPSSLEDVVTPIIEKMIQKYPNALTYSLKLTIDTNAQFRDHPLILKYMHSLLHRHEQKNFVEAMEYLVRPELYLLYHLDKLLDHPKIGEPSIIDELISKVYPDTPALQGKLYKYITKYRDEIAKMKNMSKEEIESHIKNLKEQLNKSLNKNKDSNYLRDYSPWLAGFSGSVIEIPGQYSGDREPIPEYHVKIMKIESNVQVMKSIRKPIKITMIGNDAKNYNFLVKFGEDLRLDERIEQAFGIMNEILQDDNSSSRRNLAVNTFQVTVLSGSLGLIQWIDNTKNLNDYIHFNFDKEKTELTKWDYANWIKAANPQGTISQQYKEALLKYGKQSVISKMNSLTEKTSWDLLRNTFLMLSPSLESFMATRRNFVVSYGTMCIAHWILSIGDRHLENTLISVKSGKVTGIDFASAFGGGLDLSVPELVPFRLTNQIKGLMKPFDENDELKAVMTRVLRAVRNGKGPLLAYLCVVASENLNWVEHAQQLSAEVQEKNRNINWLVKNKFEYVSSKLNGEKPTVTMLNELRNHHFDGKYFPRYVEIINGIEGSSECLRAKMNDNNLNSEDQVCCLLEQATDLNILGRLYVGLTPWI